MIEIGKRARSQAPLQDALIANMRERIDQLINANLRHTLSA
jgi:hypothetical protein